MPTRRPKPTPQPPLPSQTGGGASRATGASERSPGPPGIIHNGGITVERRKAREVLRVELVLEAIAQGLVLEVLVEGAFACFASFEAAWKAAQQWHGGCNKMDACRHLTLGEKSQAENFGPNKAARSSRGCGMCNHANALTKNAITECEIPDTDEMHCLIRY